MLQPDYERFVSTTAAPFFEAGDAGPNARQNFFCARLVTDASMAARAAAWVDESPRRDATIVALVGAERVAYEGGAASLCAARTGRSATRLLMNPPSATLERAVGAEAAVLRARRDDELAARHVARGAAAAAGGLRLVQRVPRRELHLTNIPDIRTPLLPEVDR